MDAYVEEVHMWDIQKLFLKLDGCPNPVNFDKLHENRTTFPYVSHFFEKGPTFGSTVLQILPETKMRKYSED
jgi:hypothetical protein